jgi:hypothetical protein
MDTVGVQTSDLDNHLTSRVKELMKARGFSRDQAERELAEIVADEALYQQLVAQAGLPTPGAPSRDDPASADDDAGTGGDLAPPDDPDADDGTPGNLPTPAPH